MRHMALTKKFLVFDLKQGAFLDEHAEPAGLGVETAATYTEESMQARGLNATDERQYLQVPMTKDFVDALPFELKDTDPQVPYSEDYDRQFVAEGADFVVLTEYGFYDEKYNSSTQTSRPKVRSFDLDDANLYNHDTLENMDTEWILNAEQDSAKPIIVPVSEVQQEQLKQLPQFSPEKEPHGFFMEPVGQEGLKDLGDALDELESQINADQMNM